MHERWEGVDLYPGISWYKIEKHTYKSGEENESISTFTLTGTGNNFTSRQKLVGPRVQSVQLPHHWNGYSYMVWNWEYTSTMSISISFSSLLLIPFPSLKKNAQKTTPPPRFTILLLSTQRIPQPPASLVEKFPKRQKINVKVK